MIWQPVIFGGIFVLAGVAMGAKGWMSLRTRRVMARMPTSATGSVAPGPVEVAGSAVPVAPLLRAKFGDGEAVLAIWKVEELRSSGKSSHWETVEEVRETPRFAVDDGSGRVLVDVEVASLDLPPTLTIESKMGKDPPPQVIAFLDEKKVKWEGLFGINKRMRFTETLVRPQDQVYVLGVADYVETPDKGPRMIVKTGTRAAPFIVTTRSERDESRRLNKQAWGMFAGSALFVALGLFVVSLGFK